jgi:hypothetical protein
MSALQITLWLLCGFVGVAGMVSYLRLEWGQYLQALRYAPPPSTPRFYIRAAVSLVAFCGAAYGALLTYSWAFIELLGGFAVAVTLVVAGTLFSLWLRIELQRQRYQRWQQKGAKR